MDKEYPSGDTVKWLQAFDFNQQLAAVQKEHEQEMRNVLLSFLEVLDSFDRCFAVIKQSGPASSAARSQLENFQNISSQLQQVLSRAGVRFMDCQGQPFDPHRHEAIEVQSRSSVESGIVIEEMTRGCEWRGEILRRAKVVVSGDKD